MAKETGIGVQMAQAPTTAQAKPRLTVASLFKLVSFKRVTKAKEYDDSDGNKVRRIAQALIRLGDSGIHFTANISMITSPTTGAAGVKVALPSIPAGAFFMPVFTADDPATDEQIDDWKIHVATEYVKWDTEQSASGNVTQTAYAGKNLVVALPVRHVPKPASN